MVKIGEAKMEKEIRCTYKNCSRSFPTAEAMKKHKAKDDVHEYYCKRCDYDAIDDTWLLYHQIISPKHICCPACGREFKSEGGRDRHVDIDHLPQQSMRCAGCEMLFTSASGLMAHIEEDKCSIISRKNFYQHRAERQISKDAWQAAQDPSAGTTIMSVVDGIPTTKAEPTLLDDDRAWVEMDWAGNPINDQDSELERSNQSAVAEQMSNLSLDRYPALDPRAYVQRQKKGEGLDTSEDLLDFEPERITASQHGQAKNPRKPGNIDTRSPEVRGNQSWSGTVQSSSDISDNGVSVFTARSSTTFRTAPVDRTGPGSVLLQRNQPRDDKNAHITTATQISLPSHLEIDKYWDPLSEQYACPGRKCGQRFASIETFKDHLLSDTHVDASVKCPGCLKRFKTITALVAHCESASRKCKIRHALDYDMVIRQITAGMISADGYQDDGSIKYSAQKIEDW